MTTAICIYYNQQSGMACSAIHSHLLFILLANYTCLGYFLILCDKSLLRSHVVTTATNDSDGHVDVTTTHDDSHVRKDSDDDSVRGLKPNATKKPKSMTDDVGVTVFASAILHFMVASCLLACVFMNNYEKCSTTFPPANIVVVLAFSCCFNVVAVILLFMHKTNVPHEKTALLGAELMSIVSSVFMLLVMAYFVKVPPRVLIVIESHEANQLNRNQASVGDRGSKSRFSKVVGLFQKPKKN